MSTAPSAPHQRALTSPTLILPPPLLLRVPQHWPGFGLQYFCNDAFTEVRPPPGGGLPGCLGEWGAPPRPMGGCLTAWGGVQGMAGPCTAWHVAARHA